MNRRLHEFRLRVWALLNRKRTEREIADELHFHQEMMRAKLMREGTPPREASATAQRRFGNARRWEERLRELRQFRGLESFGRDVRFAVRLLRKSPGFTAVALLTLALGVGANTTVFSIVNGLLLRPLAVPASDRLAVLEIDRGGSNPNYSFPEPVFRSLEHRHEVFAQVFAFSTAKLQVMSRDGNEIVAGQMVSGDFFSSLETKPILGRTLSQEDDRKGGNPAGFGVVISEPFWERWFNRSPDVVGRKLTIDNTVFTVIGVMPKRFIGANPLTRPELYVPLATESIVNGERSMTAAGHHAWWLNVMGRLQPGVTVSQANAEVNASTRVVLQERITDAAWIERQIKDHLHLAAEPGSTGFTILRLSFRKPLVAVFAMCGGILLLACLNLASLLMARGAARERELATRMAVGATRQRLAQQLLTESLLIALVGVLLGLAAAPLLSRSLGALLLGGQREAQLDTSLDIRVLLFAATIAVAATIVIGLAPALVAASTNLHEHIKNGQHAADARERRRWLPRVLMSCEVALALILVFGAGLLASSLVRLYRSGAGFDPRGLQNIAFSMDKQPLNGEALVSFYNAIAQGLSRVPGVDSVSFARMIPFTHYVWDDDFSGAGADTHNVYVNSVGPNYFRTMGIPMLEGREFNWNEKAATGLKVILNQKTAALLFPGQDALGRFIKMHDEKGATPYEVVGVVGNAKYEDLRQVAPPTAYIAMTQDDGHSPSYYAVVQMKGRPTPLASAARGLAMGMLPAIPAPVVTSMTTVVDDSLSSERTMALLSVFFAGCALLVTAIGLYGTLANATARRTSEIGIRMALGARRAQVVGLVCGQNARIALFGTIGGLITAIVASRGLASFLYSTSARDPWVLGGAVVALTLVAGAASLLPAIRAARINPSVAIRCD